MAAGNSEEVNAVTRDRNFTQRNDENGWSYPLIFYNTTDTSDTGPPKTKKAKKGSTDGKKTIFVNRHTLASRSPVFTRIFFDTNFADASKPELVMTDKNFDEFLEFIKCIAITDESDGTKPVDIDNLELLLRFAEEYQIRSLKRRCVAFIAQLMPTLNIKNYEQRQKLGRLFVICHRTDNTALLPADIATKMISRLPFSEIEALDVDQQTKFDLLKTKLQRYGELECAAADKPPHKSQLKYKANCNVCKHDIGGNVAGFRCSGCWVVYEYCSGCFDAHHVPAHAAGAHICPHCCRIFTISSCYDGRPDKCGCI